MSKLRKVDSNVNMDELQMDDNSMELELIKLHANYRHLSDFYASYQENTDREIHKQNQTICQLMSERRLLERIMGNFNSTDKVTRDNNKAQLTTMMRNIEQHREEMMVEYEKLNKDNNQVGTT